MNEPSDISIVRQIIEAELKKNDKVHKLFVINEIKNKFSPIRIINKVYYENRLNETDGVKNINSGALKIYRDTWRSLKKIFSIDEQDYISRKVSKSFYEFEGEKKTLNEWAIIKNISLGTLKARLRKCWSIEEALTIPVRKSEKIQVKKLFIESVPTEWIEKTDLKSVFLSKLPKEYVNEKNGRCIFNGQMWANKKYLEINGTLVRKMSDS